MYEDTDIVPCICCSIIFIVALVKHYKDKLGVGTRTFQAELRLCRDIEKYLCALINARRASPINPIIIPRCVDMKLRAEIVNGCRLS